MKMSPEKSVVSVHQQATTPKMSLLYEGSSLIKEAESPIALLLAVAQSQNKTTDDDLTSLSWLHDKDLLKGMNIVNPSPSTSVNSTPVKYSDSNSSSNQETPISDYNEESSVSTSESSSSSINSPIPSYKSRHYPLNRNKHPINVPYDPMVHVTSKPPYSFSSLIFMAIEDSHQKALPVKEIYDWILDHFPYFRNAPTGWKNSVRHNLSLNKCFQKVEKAPNLGKGSLWTVDPQYRPNLLQTLTRSPFHPCSTLDPTVYFNNNNNNTSNYNNHHRAPSERYEQKQMQNLFPYLSKTIGITEGGNALVKKETSEEPLDAVDAAAVMLSLKNAVRTQFKSENHVITTSPSQDHTYSVMDGLGGSKDENFESDDERYYLTSCRKIDFEDEEERRIKEGAETLLDLAGVTSGKRYNVDDNCDYSIKKQRRLSNYENEDVIEKPAQFRPRLLRTKKREKKTINNNNNNYINPNNNFIQNDDDWAKHRRELEVGQRR